MATPLPAMEVELFFDDDTGRILYMEAGKDFVDLLFSILLLPVGATVQLLEEAGGRSRCPEGSSITNLYWSAYCLKDSAFEYSGLQLMSELDSANRFRGFAFATQKQIKRYTGRFGFVKEDLAFLITDDLEVKLTSTKEIVTLLSKLKVEKLGQLKSLEISVTEKQGLDLQVASFTTKTVLNDVFAAAMKKKRAKVSKEVKLESV